MENNSNIQAALAEIERISNQFGKNSWQAKKTTQMTLDAKGKYFAKLAELSETEKEKDAKAFAECKSVEEYDFWMMKIRAWYHAARLKALEEYLKEVGATVPKKWGDALVIPPKRIKNSTSIGKRRSYPFGAA